MTSRIRPIQLRLQLTELICVRLEMVGDGHGPESDDVLEVGAAELQGVLDESDVAVGFRFLVPEVDAEVGSVDACHSEAA